MASQGRPVLGVDINQYEIRAIEMRPGGMAPQIARAGWIATPRGALDGDRVVYGDAVADALRDLVAQLHVSTRWAVIGIGALGSITRVLEIPRVPDEEVRTVVEGELAHYQILREGSGAFDFVRLSEPPGGKDRNPQVLLMAAEERTVAALRDIAERADLRVVAFEPTLLALYRAARPQTAQQVGAACVALSSSRAEIAVVDHGDIRLYRRVDIGSDDLVPGRKPARGAALTPEPPPEPFVFGDEAPPNADQAPPAGNVIAAAAGTLAVEIQRSLDYYRREFPQAPSVSRIVLATNDPAANPVASWLGEALQMDVVVAEPPIAMGVSRTVASQLEAPEGLRFLAAAGLAMHAASPPEASAPLVNLAGERRTGPATGASQRRLAAGMTVAVIVAAMGLGLIYNIHRQTADLGHELGHMRTELLGKRAEESARLRRAEIQRDQILALKAQGVPLPRIMDSLTSSLDPQAGLTEVNLDRAGKLNLAGDATNERAMIRTLENLKSCPYFLDTTLDTFGSKPAGAGQVVEFRITSRLASPPMQAASPAIGSPAP